MRYEGRFVWDPAIPTGKYILSKDGQTLTEKGGNFPITNEIREHDLEVLGISTLAN